MITCTNRLGPSWRLGVRATGVDLLAKQVLPADGESCPTTDC
ncbi:hypothetical protein ACFV0T_22300 [Streptomyces sp. NPDC059582]